MWLCELPRFAGFFSTLFCQENTMCSLVQTKSWWFDLREAKNWLLLCSLAIIRPTTRPSEDSQTQISLFWVIPGENTRQVPAEPAFIFGELFAHPGGVGLVHLIDPPACCLMFLTDSFCLSLCCRFIREEEWPEGLRWLYLPIRRRLQRRRSSTQMCLPVPGRSDSFFLPFRPFLLSLPVWLAGVQFHLHVSKEHNLLPV